jgi:hypothetical protein
MYMSCLSILLLLDTEDVVCAGVETPTSEIRDRLKHEGSWAV